MPQAIHSLRNYRIICNVVLFGTYLVIAAICILLVISFSLNHAPYVMGRIAACGLALLYIGTAHWLLHIKRMRAVAYMLTAFYLIIAAGMVWSWGINTPIGPLTFTLAIILAGILLAARHSLWAAMFAVLTLLSVQLTTGLGWYQPTAGDVSSFGDAFAYSTVFGMLALISWLYNREMERSLTQAWNAEAALQVQKATLKTQVQQRTKQLRQAQLKEAQQMYRFAELGQLGVTLLHDLANHLTALTLEIDDLRKAGHSKAISRARRITNYLGDIVDSTRARLNGSTQERSFNIIRRLDDVVGFLRDRAEKANVTINWTAPKAAWRFTGDASSLSQVITIIACNGIDAYSSHTTQRDIDITAERTKTHIIIRITNYGTIPKAQRKNLFKPFQTTKKSGMGLGLFIAKQTVELQFAGTLTLDPQSKHTEFVITLPHKHAK